MMKKFFTGILKIILIIIIILLIAFLILEGVYYFKVKNNMVSKMEGIIVKVNDNYISVMKEGNETDLYNISFSKDGNMGFEIGQKVLVYYGGTVVTTFPAIISNVGKIEILKDENKSEIPYNVLTFFYSSKDNLSVSVSELTNKGITFSITDTNKIPYKYPNKYIIYKKVYNEDYEEKTYSKEENTGNSIKQSEGMGAEYIWKEVDKISYQSYESTTQDLVYNLPNINEKEDYSVIGKKIDWSNIYGELTSGEYQFSYYTYTPNMFFINIKFSIDSNGQIIMDKPYMD